MNFIDMTNYNLVKTKTTSSKGNQQKWLNKNKWYKMDYMGYETLSEVVVSTLLEKSNVKNFVSYEPVKIKYNFTERTGCISRNFKGKQEVIITLEKLFKQYKGSSLAKELAHIPEIKDKIKFTVNFVEKVTGLEDVGKYFTIMIELDTFFLNEDRHTNNIAFIKNEETGKFRFCPYFDFGLSLLSDTNDYPLKADLFQCMEYVKAKPFSDDFDEQIDAITEMYGNCVNFDFTSSDIDKAVNKLYEYYDTKVLSRAKEILMQQKRKYIYMFK